MTEPHTAYGIDGEKLPLSPDEVKQTAHDILDKGSLVLVISQIGENLAVNVLGPPSRKTYEALKASVDAYKKIIEDNGL